MRAHGRHQDTQAYIDRYYAREQHEQRVRAARENLRVDDTWLPPALSTESHAALAEALAKHASDIESAYLVRKQMPQSEPPLHVVGVLRRTSMLKGESLEQNQRLIQALAADTTTNEEILFIWLNADHKTFTKLFKRVAGSRLI